MEETAASTNKINVALTKTGRIEEPFAINVAWGRQVYIYPFRGIYLNGDSNLWHSFMIRL